MRPPLWNMGEETLRRFKYSLYIEDTIQHTNFIYPSSRWYEAVMFKIVQFFDIKCEFTFAKFFLDIPDVFWVESKAEILDKIRTNGYKRLWDMQVCWRERAVREKQKVTEELRKILLT